MVDNDYNGMQGLGCPKKSLGLQVYFRHCIFMYTYTYILNIHNIYKLCINSIYWVETYKLINLLIGSNSIGLLLIAHSDHDQTGLAV